MIRTVDLSELIIIEELSNSGDGFGGYKPAWFSKYVTWAQFKPLYNKKFFGHEIAVSKQLNSVNYYEFVLRYREGVTNKMRIKLKNKYFSVVKVIDTDQQQKFLEIIAQEIIE